MADLDNADLSGRSNDGVFDRAIAANWHMDHRVTKERESHLTSSTGLVRVATGEFWKREVKSYFGRILCNEFGSDANTGCNSGMNSVNRVPRDLLPPHVRLIHMASLRDVMWRVMNRPSFRLPLFLDDVLKGSGNLTGASIDGDLPNLVLRLRDAGAATIQELAGFLSEGLGSTEPGWWATFADDVRRFLHGEDWTMAARLLGLGHHLRGTFLIAWEYDVETAAPIYRPTVVEAGLGPWHFPSPPGHEYGVTMPLDIALPCAREVVHPALKGEKSRASCIGRIGVLEEDASPENLFMFRSAHRARLTREFPGQLAWIDRHSTRP